MKWWEQHSKLVEISRTMQEKRGFLQNFTLDKMSTTFVHYIVVKKKKKKERIVKHTRSQSEHLTILLPKLITDLSYQKTITP